MEFTLLWAAITGVVLAWAGVRIWTEGLPPKPFDVLVGSAVIGLITGRLAAMSLQGINVFTDPGQLILVRGGVHTGFATLGALTALAWFVRGRARSIDALAPAAVLGLAGWHAGCIWRSACLGSASQLPWAWAQDGSVITRHPVELYAAAGLVAAAFVVGSLPSRPLLRSGTALAAAGAVRLATEPIRLSISGGPIAWYIAAIGVGVLIALAGALVSGRMEHVPT